MQKKRPKPLAAAPPQDHRTTLRHALAQYDFLEAHAEVMPEDVRALAKELGVPPLFLLIAFYANCSPVMVSIADVDEWNADPAAREVLIEWITANGKAVA